LVLLSSLGPLSGHLFKENFIGGRATDENEGRRKGRTAMKLALTQKGVAVSLA
jgi:hypothetical protein